MWPRGSGVSSFQRWNLWRTERITYTTLSLDSIGWCYSRISFWTQSGMISSRRANMLTSFSKPGSSWSSLDALHGKSNRGFFLVQCSTSSADTIRLYDNLRIPRMSTRPPSRSYIRNVATVLGEICSIVVISTPWAGHDASFCAGEMHPRQQSETKPVLVSRTTTERRHPLSQLAT